MKFHEYSSTNLRCRFGKLEFSELLKLEFSELLLLDAVCFVNKRVLRTGVDFFSVTLFRSFI